MNDFWLYLLVLGAIVTWMTIASMSYVDERIGMQPTAAELVIHTPAQEPAR